MNILTHPVHTGYQYDLAQTGNEFYSLEMPETGEVFWDAKSRPVQSNFHSLKSLDEAPVQFDAVLVHYRIGFEDPQHLNLPLIYKEHCLQGPFVPPTSWIDRISYYSFASQVAANRWRIPKSLEVRKVIIGMGVNTALHKPGRVRDGAILAVGQQVSSRGEEKGLNYLRALANQFDITIVGRGNESIRGSIGPAANFLELRRYYARHRIFLNPSQILGMATLEAMAAGMAVVTFPTINSDIISHGANGVIVHSVREAAAALTALLQDKSAARQLGARARMTIQNRFSPALFSARWNALFRLAAYEYHAPMEPKSWRPFDLRQRPKLERDLAEQLVGGRFEYCRVGYDKRPMTFARSGWVGEGRRAREAFWDIKADLTGIYLELSGGDSLTCRLKRHSNGSWKGKWRRFEKMPVIVRPLR